MITKKQIIRTIKKWYWNWKYDNVSIIWPEEEVQLEIRKYTNEHHKFNLCNWVSDSDEIDDPSTVKIVTRKQAEMNYGANPCPDTMCYGFWNDDGVIETRVKPTLKT